MNPLVDFTGAVEKIQKWYRVHRNEVPKVMITGDMHPEFGEWAEVIIDQQPQWIRMNGRQGRLILRTNLEG